MFLQPPLPGSLLHWGREASVSTRRAAEWQSGNQLTGTPINESFSQRVRWNLPPCPVQVACFHDNPPFFPSIHPPASAGGQVGKVPGGPKMPLARSVPAGGRWPKHHVHLEEAAPSFTGKGEAEQNLPRSARTRSSSSSCHGGDQLGKVRLRKQTLTYVHLQTEQTGFLLLAELVQYN